MNKILGVGHCGFDSGRFSKVISSLGGEFIVVETVEDALYELHSGDYTLVLPNRVVGGDEEGGLKLIRTMEADPKLCKVPVMMISGFADRQQEAIESGALPGFGKDKLESDEVAQTLKKYLV